MSIYTYKLGLCIAEFMCQFPESTEVATEFRDTLVQLNKKNGGKKIERVVRELAEWIEDLEPVDRSAFDKYMMSCGVTYSSLDYLAHVDQLLSKKRLRTEEEFRDLREFVERNHDEPAYKEQVDRAVTLLDGFEAKGPGPKGP